MNQTRPTHYIWLIYFTNLFKCIPVLFSIPLKYSTKYGCLRAAYIFHRTRTNIAKIYMEPQKPPNSNSDPEKEEQRWIKDAT